jgi:lysophospholipase L1-like esterase
VVRLNQWVWICLFGAVELLAAHVLARRPAAPKPLRIVFLGDSITDYDIYTALVRQALAGSGRPVCVNAGVCGDTAAAMRARLDRDVLPHRPDLVTLSAGINDVLGNVHPADFERDVAAIAERLHSRKVPLVILTTTVLGPRFAEQDRKLEQFNAALRRVARKYGCQVAGVHERMSAARRGGREVLDTDQVHPSFEGHRLLARAVLDALGHADVPVPARLRRKPLPGLVWEWQVRGVPAPLVLTGAAVGALKVDGSWRPYHLPEVAPVDNWWCDQVRQTGFAVSLTRVLGLGPARRCQGIASLAAADPHPAYLNTGGFLDAIWLNGGCVYRSAGWTGFHAGKERVPVRLRAGENTLVIEASGPFFLSCTDNNDW